MRRSGVFRWSLLFALLALSAYGWGQSTVSPLPRRGYFGVALGVHESGAVLVTAVSSGSTAEAEGIRAGDIIQSIDGMPMRTPAEVIAAIGRHDGGEIVTLELARDGRPQRRDAVLKPYPVEKMEGSSLEYGSVTANGVRLRTIVSIPAAAEKRLPAAMLIQGGGCGSIDTPALNNLPVAGQAGLMHEIGAHGFVTLRVEKSGVGDSEGPSCDSIGYEEELAGYRAGLRALKSHPAVDPDRVFLVGISLGGVFAPILADELPVRGVIVYGTLAAAPPPYPGRSERFFREFGKVDVAAAWAKIDAPVLVLRGEYDESATQADHEKIAATINKAHPGRALHRELEGLDHCWSRHATMDASRGNCGRGESTTALSSAILAFLKTA